jgi:hypothetical protein
VLNGNNLRIILTGAIAALAVAAPVSVAKQPASTSGVAVCNTATHTSLGGNMVATDGDSAPSSRFQNNLKAKKGNGAGLVNAAANSPALSLCVVPTSEPSGGDGGGSDDGGLGGIAA